MVGSALHLVIIATVITCCVADLDVAVIAHTPDIAQKGTDTGHQKGGKKQRSHKF